MADITLKTSSNQGVTVSETIQGHLLWDAAHDFRKAYAELTNLCHRLSEDVGGPHNGTQYKGAANYAIPPEQSVGMRGFAQRAVGTTAAMLDALRRMEEFHQGEVYDDLIDPTLLGPCDLLNGYRKVFVSNDTSAGPTTHIVEQKTGMSIYAGINRWEDEGERKQQPFVAITTEEMHPQFSYGGEDQTPTMAVNINDADIFDDMGEGNRLESGPVQQRIVRVWGPKHDPNNQDEGYDYTADVRFDWLKDEDGLPRMEVAHGATEKECEQSIESLIEMFQKAGQVKPGEWPKGDK